MSPTQPAVLMTQEQISEFCIVSLANVLRVSREAVKADSAINGLGLDSAMVVYLMMELEEKLDVELSPDDFYDYPTVSDLARYLTAKVCIPLCRLEGFRGFAAK
jgi:acyl carrier protein